MIEKFYKKSHKTKQYYINLQRKEKSTYQLVREAKFRLIVVSTNILPGLSYQVLPKKMHSISPVFLVVSTVFYWLSQF